MPSTQESKVMRRRLYSLVLATLACGIVSSAAAQALVPEPDRVIRDSRGGGGAAFHIVSSILGETRQVNVAVPASFATSAPERRYPVTLVFDGESHLAPVAAVSEELTRHGLIPESVIVAIENIGPYAERVRDLTPPGLSVSGSSLNEGGDRFLDFIEQELLPAVDRQFRGGLPRTLIGHSSGGILATYAAATRPAFRAVVAVDAPIHLGENWLAHRLMARATSGDDTPLRYAHYEARFAWPDAAWEAVVAAAPASWKLHREKLAQEGHETLFMLSAYLGLREVFGAYSRFAAPVAPTTRILPYYDTVGATFGTTLVPPRRLLRDVVEDFLMEGRGAAAREAYDRLVAGYGAPADSTALLAQIEEAERQPPPAETVEGLLATPFPTPEEVRPYVGEWRGDMWMKPGLPRTGDTILRIQVIDGKVAAEIEHLDAPEPYRIRHIEYLKATPEGLSFGYLNGMRPRGVLVHDGTLQGDTLAGKTRWGGITFNYPPGMEVPDPGFSFTRARP
jgi:hypothetical protein